MSVIAMRKIFKTQLPDEVASHHIVSFPKCGRTWLRMMINKIIISEYLTKNEDLLDTYNLSKSINTIPTIMFSHDDKPHLKLTKNISTNKQHFAKKNVLFLIRDPRDVIVSNYFQYTKRGDRDIIGDDFNGTISEFLRYERGSIDGLMHFYNIWAKNRTIPKSFLIIKYEDLINDSVYFLQRVLDFLKIPAKLKTVINTVDYCSFENMKKIEVTGRFGERLSPGNNEDSESFKVRKGKIGGYVDYLSSKDIDYLNYRINSGLDDYYYYYKY